MRADQRKGSLGRSCSSEDVLVFPPAENFTAVKRKARSSGSTGSKGVTFSLEGKRFGDNYSLISSPTSFKLPPKQIKF